MRLALFTDTFEPDVNGVARTLGRWVAYLRRRNVPVMVFAPDHTSESAGSAPAHDVERFMSIPFFLYPECRLALPNPRNIRRALESFRPSLIHVATPFNLGLSGVHYARKYGVPLFASYHTHFDRYLPFYNLQWMVKMLGRYMQWFHQDCRRIFVPSRSTLDDLLHKGWAPERLDIWSRGIDTETFHPYVDRRRWLAEHGIGEDTFVVFYAGRLAPEKNIGIAFDAFSAFRRGVCADALLVIAGDGPMRAELRSRSIRDGVPCRFLGFTDQPELRHWYAASDVFLFPSPTETFGNVVLEAMACGTVPVVANAGGVADIVDHGVNGLLCRASDAASFADALAQLHGSPGRRADMAVRAAAYAARQSWDAIFTELMDKCLEMENIWESSRFRHNALKRNRVAGRQ